MEGILVYVVVAAISWWLGRKGIKVPAPLLPVLQAPANVTNPPVVLQQAEVPNDLPVQEFVVTVPYIVRIIPQVPVK